MTENIFPLLLQDKKAYLDVIHTYMEVHGTVHGTSTMYIPGYVKNHGILSGRDLQFLLRETKVSLWSKSGGKKNLQMEGVWSACISPPMNKLLILKHWEKNHV